jgi:hypothetical protein
MAAATGEASSSRAWTDEETLPLQSIRIIFTTKVVKVLIPCVASRNEKRERARDEDGEAHSSISDVYDIRDVCEVGSTRGGVGE